MQQQLPPGHSLAGGVIPALGGTLQRVRRDSDSRELVARSAGSDYPDQAAVLHLDAELGAASQDDPDDILRPSERIDGQRQSWLIYEAVAGEPLDTSRPLELSEFWEIAGALAQTLSRCHRRGRIHGRLESNCVWWDPRERRVGVLGMLPAEHAHLANSLPATVETAPELLVNEHAVVRPSADVYSLGAIFYRLLSGKPVFAPKGNLAFALAADPPARLDPERVPERLSDLVSRMLSKSPSLRPADGSVVVDELEAVRNGAHSPRANLSFRPDSLVGRVFELSQLLDHARAAEAGTATIVRVAGEPGVGKSHLLSEFIRRLAARSRLVADGKFEQYQRGRPYGALLTACGNALSHALAGDDQVFTSTRQRLREADPALLGVLAADIPELEHLCGRLPEPPETGPSETETRFKRAFTELLRKLCAKDAPLILVLDDVQWADRATADLLVELSAAGLPELLLVLAYREPAASQNPDLADLFASLSGAPLLALSPFDVEETEALCRSLIPNCESVEALSLGVHQRGHGNALHCVELLRNFVANGELSYAVGRWRYTQTGGSLKNLSETLAELIRGRLARETEAMRRLLGAAACMSHDFSESVLAVATGENSLFLREQLEAAVRRGFLVASAQRGEYAFCHDRIQQVALELSDEPTRVEIYLRLGRHYRAQIPHERAALFLCLDYLNQVRDSLDADERDKLAVLNLEGARRARATIAYERAIPLVRLYLQSSRISAEERFDATMLLSECLFVSGTPAREGSSPADAAFAECEALAKSRAQKLRLLYSRLSCCVHDQDYEGAVELGLSALSLLGRPLPERPWLPRVIANVLHLSARMRRRDLVELSKQPDRASDDDLEVFRFLVGLWGPSHWVNQNLNLLVCVRLTEMLLSSGNGKHSSMAYACYAAMCHMQEQYEPAIRYGRVALQKTHDQSPYTRAIVRFITLTFFGVFERPAREVIERYDDALREVIAHGEIVASHLIDGAVTTLPHLGGEVPLVVQGLDRYEREARAMGAKTSLEMIQLVRCWSELLMQGPTDEHGQRRPSALYEPVKHDSFAAGRDILRMQIEYLWGHDEEVRSLGRAVRANVLIKGNPLHKASYALFLLLASTRRREPLTAQAREALKYLERLDSVRVGGEASPGTFRASLRLAQGVQAFVRGEANAVSLLREAADLANERGQGLVRAVSLERLAHVHGALGDYARCVEALRDAAHAYRRFGATAKADTLEREFPGIDWAPLHARASAEIGIHVEGVMRAASAIVEASSTQELGPTLLRVIATAAGAMRALLFTFSEGKLFLVAACERDRQNLSVSPTPLEEIDADSMALKPIRRVERSHEIVELPRDRSKFLDDGYLSGSLSPRALLCVPLVYRGELVAILYLENSSHAEIFSPDEVTLVTLLGKQAAIAMTNADNHRLEIEALQSKVNPHFLYNALSVVAELVGRSPEQAEEAVYKLTRLYRYMLSTPAEQRVPLDKELALVRDYLELEKARFGERLRIDWQIDKAVRGFLVPALLVQPLAENAVNHGVRRNLSGGTVTIAARVRNDSLLISVSDDGPGWYEGRGGTGFGLKSVRRRLQLVYGTRAELRIVKQNGVVVELNIPI